MKETFKNQEKSESKNPFVSVVIPVYNSEKTIKGCVSSVLGNDYNNFEVIAVDDFSNDGTLAILKNIRDSKLRIIEKPFNSGNASVGRNIGIKEAKGEIILLLDSDSFVKSDWIRRHVRVYAMPARGGGVDIVGGGIKGICKTVFGRADYYCSWWTSVPNSKDMCIRKLHLPTNNLSVKKSVFDKIGLFDESLRTGEDAEFFSRVFRNRFIAYFKSDIIVKHLDRDNLRDFLRHHYIWGLHAVGLRARQGMDYGFLMPKSYASAWFYILPLALLYTGFTIWKWMFYKPQVIFYTPLIFIGKLAQSWGIKDSFKKH